MFRWVEVSAVVPNGNVTFVLCAREGADTQSEWFQRATYYHATRVIEHWLIEGPCITGPPGRREPSELQYVLDALDTLTWGWAPHILKDMGDVPCPD